MNLLEYRRKNDISQSVLAKKIGVTTAAISQYENGRREPNIEILKKMAKALECTVDELISDTNKKEKEK